MTHVLKCGKLIPYVSEFPDAPDHVSVTLRTANMNGLQKILYVYTHKKRKNRTSTQKIIRMITKYARTKEFS
jgi:hypothetical protein